MHRLPPGHYALLEHGKLTVAPYWQPQFNEGGGSFETLRDEFRAVAHASGHPLEVLASDAPALGDEERILRVGRALVENALRHTPPGTSYRLPVRFAPIAQ